MKFLLKTRQKIGNSLLRRKAAKVHRTKSYHNIDSAQHIGLLFDSTVPANYFSARRFFTNLTESGKNVSALGMVLNEEMLRYYTPTPNINLFSLEKTTFFGFPDNPEVMLTAASGQLVPIETTVSPITTDGILSIPATEEAPSTKKSAPLISRTNPTINST